MSTKKYFLILAIISLAVFIRIFFFHEYEISTRTYKSKVRQIDPATNTFTVIEEDLPIEGGCIDSCGGFKLQTSCNKEKATCTIQCYGIHHNTCKGYTTY